MLFTHQPFLLWFSNPEHVTHGIPPPPADMDAIVRANLGL